MRAFRFRQFMDGRFKYSGMCDPRFDNSFTAPHCYFDCYYLEQFTGLLDKNGEEVYEGDIIKYKNGDEYSIGEVRYLSARYVLITSLGYHGFTTSDIEILGNIHQHIELLKDKS